MSPLLRKGSLWDVGKLGNEAASGTCLRWFPPARSLCSFLSWLPSARHCSIYLFFSLAVLAHPLLVLLTMGQLSSISWHLGISSLWYNRLRVYLPFPSPGSHWHELSFPSVNCKPNFWIDCLWPRYNRTCALFSCCQSGEGEVSGDTKHAHLSRRAHRPWEFSWEGRVGGQAWRVLSSVLRFSSLGPVELDWRPPHVGSDQVQNSSRPTRLQLSQICCGTSMWEKHACGLHLAREVTWSLSGTPPSLLKIQKDSVQVVDFGVRNTSMLSPS